MPPNTRRPSNTTTIKNFSFISGPRRGVRSALVGIAVFVLRAQSADKSAHSKGLSFVDHFLDQHRQFRRCGLADFISRLNSGGRHLSPTRIIAKDHSDRISRAKLVANLGFAHETDSRIDLVFDADATAASLGDGMAHLLGINPDDKS